VSVRPSVRPSVCLSRRSAAAAAAGGFAAAVGRKPAADIDRKSNRRVRVVIRLTKVAKMSWPKDFNRQYIENQAM